MRFTKRDENKEHEAGVTIMPADHATKKARGEIDRLNEARAKLDAHYSEVRAELYQLWATAGDAHLDAFLAGDAAAAGAQRARIRELESEERSTAEALAALIPRLIEKHRLWNLSRGGEFRKRAADLQEKLDAHVRRRDELHKDLCSFAECDYVTRAEAVQALIASGGPSTAFANLTRPQPGLAARMQREITQLLQQAQAFENRQPPVNGRIDGATLDELLAAVDDPERIAPTRPAITAWHARAERQAAAAAAHSVPPGAAIPPYTIHFELNWTEGQIDESTSKWTRIPPPQQPAPKPVYRTDHRPPDENTREERGRPWSRDLAAVAGGVLDK